ATRAVLGRAQRSAYSATKAGMIGYTRTWALELGKRGITVNTIAPGPVATDLFERNNPRGSAEREKIMSMLAVPEIGTPDDVASAVSFFLSDASRYITGQTLFVCGGSSIGAAPI
ncbi:MAG: SDR family NAD(P)-dependent oxidoreductase, partial [Thermomicrobiales bacterium]